MENPEFSASPPIKYEIEALFVYLAVVVACPPFTHCLLLHSLSLLRSSFFISTTPGAIPFVDPLNPDYQAPLCLSCGSYNVSQLPPPNFGVSIQPITRKQTKHSEAADYRGLGWASSDGSTQFRVKIGCDGTVKWGWQLQVAATGVS